MIFIRSIQDLKDYLETGTFLGPEDYVIQEIQGAPGIILYVNLPEENQRENMERAIQSRVGFGVHVYVRHNPAIHSLWYPSCPEPEDLWLERWRQ